MRTVDVGILIAPQVEFELLGEFRCNGQLVTAKNAVSIEGNRLLFNGVESDEFSFVPAADDCRFVLHDVLIGVNFHWQRRENQTFKGELRFIVENGQVRAINRLFIEDYLVSVISSEMSATSSLEFLKAHTVISRSWLYAQLHRKERVQAAVLGYETPDEVVRWYAREDHTLFDLCADDHCQRYQGLTRAINPNVQAAVKATENIVLKYDGEVCDARFSKCCGGATERFSTCWEDADYVYLDAFRDTPHIEPLPPLETEEGARAWIESVPDAFCSAVTPEVLSQVLNNYDRETSDFYRWQVEYSQEELSRLVAERSGIDFGVIEELQPVERGASGRLVKLRIVGSKAVRVVGKELEIRRWLSPTHLYSSAFVVDKIEKQGATHFLLKGAGWGHGVGLCQIGAAVMGERGCSYEQILQHYYPGAILAPVD
ncbi:MAG: SpoIID/LytB domain-containing protein [Bacteroidaceae bacterium]|nr:SpoIID/LytB domain-containing protein [Bacteroidaceae bacterium]